MILSAAASSQTTSRVSCCAVGQVSDVLESERPVIDCRDVHKWYDGFHALKGVSLPVSVGETVVIVGPSGSGKSTFIRVLNRMERHERGDVTVNGVTLTDDVRDIDAVRRGVACPENWTYTAVLRYPEGAWPPPELRGRPRRRNGRGSNGSDVRDPQKR